MLDKQKAYDVYNLIFQGRFGTEWIYQCEHDANIQDMLVKDAFKIFKAERENINMFNSSQLIMISYLSLVYLRENIEYNEYENIIGKLDISIEHFTIDCKDENPDLKYLVRRLRNSIAHGNFEIIKDSIIFKDNNRRGTDPFKSKVNLVQFGNFMNKFCFDIRDIIFKK